MGSTEFSFRVGGEGRKKKEGWEKVASFVGTKSVHAKRGIRKRMAPPESRLKTEEEPKIGAKGGGGKKKETNH